MIRLFVAISLPDEVRNHLAAIRGGVPGATWVPPENLHLTLRFIGEVDEGLAREIDAALMTVQSPPFELVVRGLGLFGKDHRVHTIWAGIDPSDDLRILKGRIEAALRTVGLEADTRRYTPHISLGRLKHPQEDRLRTFIETRNLDVKTSFQVRAFTLYSSLLTRDGPLYRAEADYLQREALE